MFSKSIESNPFSKKKKHFGACGDLTAKLLE